MHHYFLATIHSDMQRILTILFLFLSSFAALAQNGTLRGKVSDAATKEPMIGATVILEGTSLGAAVDVDGAFEIANVPAGKYNLVISAVGYSPKKVEGVEVFTGKVTTISTDLQEDVNQLGEVTIVAAKETNTVVSVLREIREAEQVVSGISAEQIALSLDRDAAQVVRRIPGVKISEFGFIQVRGLPERYNNVLLHNVFAPSVETDVKAFAFDIVPSSQLDRVLVFKSPAAELPGEFAGGIVKVFTKSIPDRNILEVNYNTQYRLGTTFNEFQSRRRTGLDFLGFNDGTDNLPSSFPRNLRANSITPEQLAGFGREIPNTWIPENRNAFLDQRINITGAFRTNSKSGVEIGSITSLTYSNSFTTFDIARSDYNAFSIADNAPSPIYETQDMLYTQSTRIGLLHNWAFRFNPRNLVEIKNLVNQNLNDQFTDRFSSVFENGTLQQNGSFNKSYRGVYAAQVLGKHDFGSDAQNTLDWVAGFSRATRQQPDYRRFRTDVGGDKPIVFVPIAQSPNFLGNFYSDMAENTFTAAANWKQELRLSDNLRPILKAGFYTEYRTRSFDARNLGFVRANPAQFDLSLLELGIGQVFNPANINTSTGLEISDNTNASDAYDITNFLQAVYAQMNFKFGEKWNLIAGVRVENNQRNLLSGTNAGARVDEDFPVLSVLPSANLSYNITDKMLLRAAYGVTVNRPEFREQAPFAFYDFDFNFTYQGTPLLETATIQNLDLRWELYPSDAEVISVGAFYKQFDNPIEVQLNPGAGSLGAKTFEYRNANAATSYGVEVELRKSLSFLGASKFLKDISLIGNAAYIESNVDFGAGSAQPDRPLQGQARYIANAGLFYDNQERGLRINLLYNVTGRNIVFVGSPDQVEYPDIYVMPRNVIDLTFSKSIGEKLQLRGGVSDLLNQEVLYLQDGNQDGKFERNFDQAILRYRPGQLFSLGFNYLIF